MIHHRPGFASRSTDTAPARLNEDMIPALHRKRIDAGTPLKQSLQARTDQAHEKLIAKRALEDAQAAAARAAAGPELILNHNPSAPPVVLVPGK
jgi:hypothetical protein